MAVVAAACGGDDDDASTPDDSEVVGTETDTDATVPETETTETTGGSVAGEPVRGGTLTIGVTAETDRFDPGNGNIAFPARAVHHLVYGSLTATTRDGEWVPYLAESVESNADATVWTVTLRPDLVFHDGNPLNAEAVKASMDRYRFESINKAAVEYITDTVVVDELTIEITLNKSFGVFPQALADEIGTIVSIAATEEFGDAYGDHPTGAGPYKVVEYVRDDHLTLERVEGFFMDNRGWADTIIIRPIPDDAARSAALRAGDLDIIETWNPVEIASFRGDDNFQLHEEANGAAGLLFSVAHIPEIRVRQAVAMAIDREQLIDLVWNGVGEPVTTPFPEDSFWHAADVEYPEYDPAAAQALIEEVEAETGTPVAFRILSATDDTATNYKLAVAEQLRAIGIDVEIQTAADVNDYVNLYIEGEYDVFTAGVFALIDPWFEYTRRYSSTSILNGTGFEDAALDEALLAAEASTDPAVRKENYDLVQKLLADNMVQMFVTSNTAAIVTSNDIEGYGTLVGPDGEPTLGNFPLFLRADEFWRNDG
jgi:peptide/nickel transport system substrate-binding protein